MEFRSNFICGNGVLIEHQTRDDEDYIVFIAEQKFNEAKPIWFYFRVSGLTKERTVFRIGNAHQFLMDADISEFAGDAPVYRELMDSGSELRNAPLSLKRMVSQLWNSSSTTAPMMWKWPSVFPMARHN